MATVTGYDWDRIGSLLQEWHEAGRTDNERRFPNWATSTYEEGHWKHVGRVGPKWACLDEGTSGAFVVERYTGDVYCIKAYGVPHRKKLVGNVATLTRCRSCRTMLPTSATRCTWCGRDK